VRPGRRLADGERLVIGLLAGVDVAVAAHELRHHWQAVCGGLDAARAEADAEWIARQAVE
jgi:hypothetical protein